MAAKRLPAVYGYREHVLDGGLISYGVDLRWCYHRGAYFVDKILHGTPPGWSITILTFGNRSMICRSSGATPAGKGRHQDR
jgi:hypothetical protein